MKNKILVLILFSIVAGCTNDPLKQNIYEKYHLDSNLIEAEIINIWRDKQPCHDGSMYTHINIKFNFGNTEFIKDCSTTAESIYNFYKDKDSISIRLHTHIEGFSIMTEGYDYIGTVILDKKISFSATQKLFDQAIKWGELHPTQTNHK